MLNSQCQRQSGARVTLVIMRREFGKSASVLVDIQMVALETTVIEGNPYDCNGMLYDIS